MTSPSAVAAGDGMVATQAARRRTFAIISHPDARKTTLSEKLLLYSDQITVAGSVDARGQRAATTSHWMDIERRRGISRSRPRCCASSTATPR